MPNCTTVTVQNMTLIKRDLALISVLTRLVYPRRIQEPIPYPIVTVKTKSMTSISL